MKRTVLITGCSDDGLGSHLAMAFHEAGFEVIATARDVSKMSTMVASGITTLALDVLSQSSLEICVAEVSKITDGKLDILVNNAGAGCSMPVLDLDPAELERVFKLNVFTPIAVTKAFIPLLSKAAASGPGGNFSMVVNNASVASVIPAPFQGAYAASKSAIAMLTEVLRLELGPFDIRAISLVTGTVKSNFYSNLQHPKIPEDSLFAPASDVVESSLAGEPYEGQMVSAEVWAKQVVGDLSKKNPPKQIWRGGFATLARISALMPVGTFDSMYKKVSGLGEAEKQIRAGKTESDKGKDD